MTIKTLLLISILFIQGCYAGLPASVSGQPIPSLAPMLEQVTPAVVNIATEGHVQVGSNALLNDPFFRNFFNLPKQLRRKKVESLRSGVVVDARRGYIITNSHPW